MDFHGNINLKDNEMQKLIFQQETDFPVDSVTGSVVFKGNILYMSVAVGNDLQPVWIPLTASIDTYVHTQTSAATTWTISHALGDKFPLVQVYDDNHEMIIPDSIVPDNTTTLAITFSTAVSGVAVVMHGDEIPANGIGIIEPPAPGLSISNLSYDMVSKDISALISSPLSIRFNVDGTIMLISANGDERIHEFTLTPGFDISNPVFLNNSLKWSLQDGAIRGISFSPSGLKLYLSGVITNSIYQYTLSSAFSTGTAVYDSVVLDVSSQSSNPNGVSISTDGLKLHVLDSSSDTIYQYTLSSSFDLSTATYDNISIDISAEDMVMTDLHFNDDGTKLILIGDENNNVYEYVLSSGFDISTAAYNNVFSSVGAEGNNPMSLTFNTLETKCYVLDTATATINQYSV